MLEARILLVHVRPTGRLATFSHPIRDCQNVSFECEWTCVALFKSALAFWPKMNGGEDRE